MSAYSSKTSFLRTYLYGETHLGFWSSVAKGIGLFNTFFIISSMTLYQYGVFQLLLATYGFLSDITSLGGGVVNNDIARAVGEKKEREARQLFVEFYGLRFVVNLLLFCSVFFGAALFFPMYGEEFVGEVRVIAFMFLVDILSVSVKTLLSIRLSFKTIAIRGTISKVAQFFILVYFFFFLHIGINEVIISMIVGSLATSLLLLSPAVRGNRAWFGVGWAGKRFMLLELFSTHGKWELVGQLFARVSGRFQPWLIKVFISTEAVAVFSVAQTIINHIRDLLPVRTLPVLIPLDLSDRERIQKIFSRGVKYLLFLSVALSLGALVTIPIIITLFFNQYTEALPYFYLMLLSIPISAVGVFISIFFVSFRKQKFLFIQEIFKNAVMIISFIFLLPLLGLWGMALERIITSSAMVISSYYYMHKVKPGVRLFWRDIIRFDREDLEFFANLARRVGAKFGLLKSQ